MRSTLETTGSAPALAVKGISKHFPGVQALQDVTFELRAGQVTALTGENGAGKSTLIKILVGIHQPDDGQILVSGKPMEFSSPRDAWSAGLAAIHQEVAMFDDLSVAENIFMGHMPVAKYRMVDWSRIKTSTNAILRTLETRFDAETPLRELRISERHLVEVARVLAHDARVVIMDEPTAALSAEEVDGLFQIVDRLKAEGRAILFISHKFDEIFRIADRWVCLRDGYKVGEGEIADVTPADLIKLMVGRSIDQLFPARHSKVGELALEVEGLSNDQDFEDISFTVSSGQIVGFYGLVGSGRSEIMQAIFGLTGTTQGAVRIKGKSVCIRSPTDAIRAGIAYVPEDRQSQGAILPFSIRENITVGSLRRYTRLSFLSRDAELKTVRKLGNRFSVRAASWEQRLGELSGGNQQKVVIAKWIATRPKILILDEPTKGIDIGSKAAVYEFMSELTAAGLAIVLVSSELPEVLALSDEVIVMYGGRIAHRFSGKDCTPEAVVTCATGGRRGA
jgi:rhamnose transport system ATP-binding protein